MSLVSFRDVVVSYGKKRVLHGVNLDVNPGEILTVVGPNGSGKSTLVRIAIGACRPSQGTLTRAPHLRIGYVPQALHADPSLPLTVKRFLNLPRRVSTNEVTAALTEAGVAELSDAQVADLSGGQFQRVLLARALINRPNLLVLDEATQGLDQPGSAAFYRKIQEVRDTLGCAILMVSHELHVVMAASDRVICLNGHICCEGAPEAVATAPEYRALFGSGTGGALALYRHEHNHSHEDDCAHDHQDHEAAK